MSDRKLRRIRPLEERFWSCVDRNGPMPTVPGVEGNCWQWLKVSNPEGYGKLRTSQPRGFWLVHRYSYQLHGGTLEPGMHIDHLCRNRACVNPAHLEQVTVKENILRGVGLSAANKRKTECLRGHPLEGANPKIVRGWRSCRECERIRAREWRARKRSGAPSRASVLRGEGDRDGA